MRWPTWISPRGRRRRRSGTTLVRLGTSGAIQPDIKVGQFVFARTSVGFDGLLNYYKGRNEVCDLEIEGFYETYGLERFASEALFHRCGSFAGRAFRDVTIEGITIAAPASMRRRDAGCVSNRPTSI